MSKLSSKIPKDYNSLGQAGTSDVEAPQYCSHRRAMQSESRVAFYGTRRVQAYTYPIQRRNYRHV